MNFFNNLIAILDAVVYFKHCKNIGKPSYIVYKLQCECC